MKILITGFEPFENDSINPSWEAVKILPDTIDRCSIIKREIPVVFTTSCEIIRELIEIERPDAVLLVGQGGKSNAVTPEFVAINQRNGRADNAGMVYHDEKIFEDAPDAYFTTLPVREMTNRISASGIPAKLTYSAGTHLCNNLMFAALHYIAINKLNIPCGFVHIPFSLKQAVARGGNVPCMDIRTSARALRECVLTIIDHSV